MDQPVVAGSGERRNETQGIEEEELGGKEGAENAETGRSMADFEEAESQEAALPEGSAMLRRLGLNRLEVIGVLRDTMVGSIDPMAPMRIIKYKVFKEFGRIPRSSDKQTVLLSEAPDFAKLVFMSHRWLRPWHTKEECEKEGHEWAGMAHPDDSKATKHKLICDGIEQLAESKGWDLEKVYLWIDFAGVEQDDKELLKAGVASLRGYITLCDAFLIPAPAVPEGWVHTVDMVPGGYGERGWTRLEAMSMYAVSVLQQVEAPEIWVVAGNGTFLERFDYVLQELPSAGVLFSEEDREYIKMHEDAMMREIKECAKWNGFVTKHKRAVRCVAYDPKDVDGDRVASGGEDGLIKLVNTQTGTVVWTVDTKNKVYSLSFSADGGMLAAGRSDGVVQVWTVAGSRPVEKGTMRGHSGWVFSVTFSPNGMNLASSSADGTIKLWDVSGKTPVETYTLHGHKNGVYSVAYSPDSMTVASASFDQTVKLWDLSCETPVAMHTMWGHRGEVFSVAYSPDCKTLASTSYDDTIQLWDVSMETPVVKCTLIGHKKEVFSVAYSPDLKTLASSSYDNTVKIWDLSLEKPVEKYNLKGHSDGVNCVAFSPDGNALASGSWDKTVRVWNPKTIGGHRKLTGHLDAVTSLVYSPDSKTVTSASCDGSIKLWDLSAEHPVEKFTLSGHSGAVLSVAYSPDSNTLVSASTDNCIKIWDVSGDTPVETGTLRGHTKGNPGCTCKHDDGIYRNVYVFNTMCPTTGHTGRLLAIAYSPVGSTIASASWDCTVRLWDPKTLECKGTLRGHSAPVNSVAFSPDSKFVASGSGDIFSRSVDNSVHIWKVSKRKSKKKGKDPWLVGVLKGHSERVRCVAWNHDGSLLASASDDNTVKLWDPTTMEEKGNLKIPEGPVWSLSFSLDGNTTACGSSDSAVRLWGLEGKDTQTEDDTSKVMDGVSAGSKRTGQYLVTAHGDQIDVYTATLDGLLQGEPLLCFRSPANVSTVVCRGISVVAGCSDGQVLFLEAPLLGAAALVPV